MKPVWLADPRRALKKGREAVPVMSTKHAVTDAFVRASQSCATKYTPHAVKHTMSATQDSKYLTHSQRSGWSEDMGHENERITEAHYAKLSDDERAEVLESIEEKEIGNDFELSDDGTVAFFDQVLAKFRTK